MKLRERIPPGLVEITRIPGLGPKRVRQLHDALGIASLDDLRRVAEAGQLGDVPGFGAKAQENVLDALAAGARRQRQAALLLSKALEIGEALVEGLRPHAHPRRARRQRAADGRHLQGPRHRRRHRRPAALVEAFAELPEVDDVQRPGDAGAKAMTHTGLPVDLRIVPEETFGNLLQHFTGSGKHNEALRTAAVKRGLHVSEYGIVDDEARRDARLRDRGGGLRAARHAVHRAGAAREPRRARGGARRTSCRELIELDRHPRRPALAHDRLGRPQHDRARWPTAARERGYEYLAITDHSATHGFGNDVQPDELRRQIERVRATRDRRLHAARRHRDEHAARRLASTTTTSCSSELDWVVASVHTSFRMAEEEMTDAHGRRDGAPARRRDRPPDRAHDRQARGLRASTSTRVIEAAVRTGTFLEINANPNRRDLTDTYAPRGGRGGRDARDRLRRPRRRHAGRTCATASRPRGAPG